MPFLLEYAKYVYGPKRRHQGPSQGKKVKPFYLFLLERPLCPFFVNMTMSVIISKERHKGPSNRKS